MTLRKWFAPVLAIALLPLILVTVTNAQGPAPRSPHAAFGTAFTYQGHLKNASGSVNAACSLQFDLWDALTGGTHIAGPVNGSPNPVALQVDFGAGVFKAMARRPTVDDSRGQELRITRSNAVHFTIAVLI